MSGYKNWTFTEILFALVSLSLFNVCIYEITSQTLERMISFFSVGCVISKQMSGRKGGGECIQTVDICFVNWFRTMTPSNTNTNTITKHSFLAKQNRLWQRPIVVHDPTGHTSKCFGFFIHCYFSYCRMARPNLFCCLLNSWWEKREHNVMLCLLCVLTQLYHISIYLSIYLMC